MKTHLKTFSCLFFVVPILVLYSCSKPTDPDDHAGTASETCNVALVSGRLYTSSGPAKDAAVYFIPVNYNPHAGGLAKIMASSDSVTTDSTGLYGTDSLDSGIYNIFGEDTSGDLSLVDSVVITGDSQVLEDDTLKAPGSIAGFIKLEPGDDPEKIIPIVMGSNKFSFTESNASFSLTDMAEGEYWVKFFSTLDNYDNLDTTLTIQAGKDSTLTDSIVMPLKIPKVTGLKISYDTLKQITSLSWDKMDSTKVKGYNVYRQLAGSAADSLLTPVPITDTFYVDSTGIQNETYVYRVASVNNANEVGTKTDGDSLLIIGAYAVIDSFGGPGSGNGQFDNPSGLALTIDSSVLIADVKNHRIQEFDYSGNFLSSFGSFGTDSGQFNNPIDVAVDSAGNIFIADFMNNRIHKFDNQFNTLVIQDSGLYRPQTMAIDSRGNLYVNEISNPTIKKYDNDLNLLLEWGRGGSYPDAIGGSQSLAIDSLDRIHIVAHSRVVIFDTLGNFIDAIFEDASGDTFFTNPTDISILGNKISVIDTYQILEFDIEGNLITKWGAKNYYKLIILPNNHIWATYLTDQLIYRYQRR